MSRLHIIHCLFILVSAQCRFNPGFDKVELTGKDFADTVKGTDFCHFTCHDDSCSGGYVIQTGQIICSRKSSEFLLQAFFPGKCRILMSLRNIRHTGTWCFDGQDITLTYIRNKDTVTVMDGIPGLVHISCINDSLLTADFEADLSVASGKTLILTGGKMSASNYQ